MSFSTAHKHLGELERAGFLSSKIVHTARKKKMHALADFKIELSPEMLALRGGEEKTKKCNCFFFVVDTKGRLQKISYTEVKKAAVSSGIPIHVSEGLLSHMRKRVYNGITLTELRLIMVEFFEQEIQKIENMLSKTEEFTVFAGMGKHNILSDSLQSKICNSYLTGGVDIFNVEENMPTAVQHDARKILGAFDSRSKEDASLEIKNIIELSRKSISGPQSIDHFNIFFSPYFKKYSTKMELKSGIKRILSIFEKNESARDAGRTYITIDTKTPDHLKKEPAMLGSKAFGNYGDYEHYADEIANNIIELYGAEKITSPNIIFKLWPGWENEVIAEKIEALAKINKVYFANMAPFWQLPDASYMHEVIRLGSEGNTKPINGTGNVQSIGINLPRLAISSNSDEDEFHRQLDCVVAECVDFLTDSCRRTSSKIFTDLPLIGRRYKGRTLFDFENATYTVGVCALNEASEMITGNQLHESKDAVSFGLKILRRLNDSITRKNNGLRIDIGEYIFRPALNRFYYQDLMRNPKNKILNKCRYSPGTACATGTPFDLRAETESKFHTKEPHGHISVFEEPPTIERIKKACDSGVGFFRFAKNSLGSGGVIIEH